MSPSGDRLPARVNQCKDFDGWEEIILIPPPSICPSPRMCSAPRLEGQLPRTAEEDEAGLGKGTWGLGGKREDPAWCWVGAS